MVHIAAVWQDHLAHSAAVPADVPHNNLHLSAERQLGGGLFRPRRMPDAGFEGWDFDSLFHQFHQLGVAVHDVVFHLVGRDLAEELPGAVNLAFLDLAEFH